MECRFDGFSANDELLCLISEKGEDLRLSPRDFDFNSPLQKGRYITLDAGEMVLNIAASSEERAIETYNQIRAWRESALESN